MNNRLFAVAVIQRKQETANATAARDKVRASNKAAFRP